MIFKMAYDQVDAVRQLSVSFVTILKLGNTFGFENTGSNVADQDHSDIFFRFLPKTIYCF